jgi:chaperonin cofactor prefoldin
MNEIESDQFTYDNLAEDLRSLAFIIDGVQTKAVFTMLSGSILVESAEAIEQLQKQVELLEARNESLQRQLIDLAMQLET